VNDQDARLVLARRLRAFREARWPNLRITQAQLAKALGGKKPLSVPLISCWESATNPRIPSIPQLEAYATFFATERSAEAAQPRMLNHRELTGPERRARDELLRELMILRNQAVHATVVSRSPATVPGAGAQKQPTVRVAALAVRAAAAATRLLPAADRARYDDEYRSELWDLAAAGAGRRQQILCALRQLYATVPLRFAILAPRRKASP
jgi:hypothetical protein